VKRIVLDRVGIAISLFAVIGICLGLASPPMIVPTAPMPATLSMTGYATPKAMTVYGFGDRQLVLPASN
jgi:hypothetical protein